MYYILAAAQLVCMASWLRLATAIELQTSKESCEESISICKEPLLDTMRKRNMTIISSQDREKCRKSDTRSDIYKYFADCVNFSLWISSCKYYSCRQMARLDLHYPSLKLSSKCKYFTSLFYIDKCTAQMWDCTSKSLTCACDYCGEPLIEQDPELCSAVTYEFTKRFAS